MKKILKAFSVTIILMIMTGCHKSNCEASLNHAAENLAKAAESSGDSRSFASINFCEESNLLYANQFEVKKSGNYSLITIAGNEKFLLVPEDEPVPVQIPKEITVLKQPLNKTYLISSAAMDFVAKTNSLSSIKYSCLREKDWFVPEAKDAFKIGNLQFAGKYSAPDFELLAAGGCNFAVANTMLFHKPEIREKLEELGIPVMVERSVYESNPLGKLEWVRLYGMLFGNEELADSYFKTQISKINLVTGEKNTGKKIAFFYVNSTGAVNVRKPGDYIVKMIEMAGGNYVVPERLNKGAEKKASATVNIQMEEFYDCAANADILIYNSTVDGMLEEVSALLAKNQIFADFTAVENNNVYCTKKSFFQASTGIADFITDIHNILIGEDENLQYIEKMR